MANYSRKDYRNHPIDFVKIKCDNSTEVTKYIMIYLFTDYEKLDDEVLGLLEKKLPPARLSRYRSFRFPEGKKSSLSAYLCFLFGYRQLTGSMDIPEFDIGEYGKPYLSENPGIFFNISHCKGGAVCFFEDEEVGIDLQNFTKCNSRVWDRVCSEEELDALKKAEKPEEAFIKLWTLKESLAKLSRKGMVFGEIDKLNGDGVNIFSTSPRPDLYLTAATKKTTADFTIRRLSLEDFILL